MGTGRSRCAVITFHDMTRQVAIMASIKISSKVEEAVWLELQALAAESHQTISGLLTEAIRDYVRRRRVRPEVLTHLEHSMREHDELGRRLAE